MQSVKCKTKFKILKVFSFTLWLYALTFTLFAFPVHAQSPIPIGEKFGFGEIKSLGEGTSRLVAPTLAVAAFLVILYFLLGAFKYLISGGNKEELEGARRMIYHAIIGFFILMLAFLILQFLLSFIFGIEYKLIG